MLGHLFPVWLRFKGGKGVATGYGVLIAAAWPVGLAAGAVWLDRGAAARFSSLAALAPSPSPRCSPGRWRTAPSLSWR